MVDLIVMRMRVCLAGLSVSVVHGIGPKRYKLNDNRHHHVTHKMKFLVFLFAPVQLNPFAHTQPSDIFFFFLFLDVSLFPIRPRNGIICMGWMLFEAEINLKSEMDLRLPNFREIFVFRGVHKTFPLWRWTTNDAKPWRSRTGTPLRGNGLDMWIKIQFEMRRDGVRKRIFMEINFDLYFSSSFFWKYECAAHNEN